MKKFLIGLMFSCMVVFSFNVVGNCLTPQTIESAYLPIGENSWFKLEVEQQARGNSSRNFKNRLVSKSNETF
jgi:hypothetical protein